MGRLTGGDPSLLRRINSAVVLHALRGSGSATLTDLTRITGLSRPTVEGVVEGLVASGLVAETGPDEGEARRQGRPARRFRFRAEAGHLLGVEIGPHRVAVLLSGLDGRIIGSGSREVSETACADDRLERVRGVVADVLRRTGVARSSLRAVGVGTPGIVEADGTVRLGTALPGWTGLALGERLRRSFRCPVLVENDANAAAVAEHWKGAGTDSDDLVFVLAGLSPGAGSLIGGRLHRGYGGAAGEIGALHLLGREVTPETLLSTTGEPLHPLDERAVAGVFAEAREGDERALAAVDRFIQRLVHDVAALVLALDPELVVVGGWAAGLDGVLPPLRDELSRYCLRPPRVALSLLGEAAVATGALRLALDHVEEQLFAVEGTVTARR
ncbi:ROK family transcriptional regulator [Streptomyces tirandamycinicus]|uniref:ROK family transcriptional regulator n=1 Tax=Streptomyces tirandamycinicus TaxID=2174846 RepID=A0A2S1T2T7_9ACTN|nr:MULTISPECIES: ROK family transcriptional regulator [Streptomyces]AWI32994.1 ROK family transcriptional regulator [Streptomyces tirandamycinicus]MCY0982584.1 ROK family transcriptional regulator [Streptomyces tirandamycinicus]NNJ04571.1 ROK family transcriptional regulator [Streptomyces sp. PKU-MA01144]TFE50075.1 ROK family transcriptional regulator [Streptomyces sp. ICN441]